MGSSGGMSCCACATSAAVRVRLKGTVALLPVATTTYEEGDGRSSTAAAAATNRQPPPLSPGLNPAENASAGRVVGNRLLLWGFNMWRNTPPPSFQEQGRFYFLFYFFFWLRVRPFFHFLNLREMGSV